ncbi:sulfite reductase (NADPH) alpha subunit [Halobacillus karajensis]|uniref:assimilatory sulfite reductase (NADPH) n=1 Tax=Halobacillus karajensis TaxID=195088 RepID=A0A024P1S0_9BACI|nr:assimilatory sulfite reductase (NADPH) flavoprotein subunit [Halobacillus karajensis]CDQ19784.1 Sulfite reductase [NADPH] flavoprotein alpha-component [Halobacillus karajensis]CDQ22244.1 Sulfite reductase [NADPH] flavoprotein alpha-component [Halobacillus karajensis]CDQ28085.1 Sulfite reductase [NADPH] flavoprotein alpha-component [Halobacillus karajensis]SEH72225.1 sulfite reductase (NADPH) alpha subunit [Halobacillus karajensis]
MELQVMNSPFNQEQTELLNQLLLTLDDRQKIWLSGYLAAAQAPSVPAGNSVQTTEKSTASRQVTILYGSHTGNCQGLAEEFTQHLKDKGFTVKLSDMDDYKTKSLKNEEDLIILTSTHGDGDPPDNALTFYEFLYSKRAPKLDGVRYSVLALGDSSYEFFCQTGKEIDERLAELGAERIHPRVDCDLDFEEDAEAWWEAVFNQLDQSQKESPALSQVAATVTDQPVFSKKNPFQAEVLENINLNGRGSNKETRHIELDLEGSNLKFEPGDSLGVFPKNDEALVDAIIEEMGWDPDLSIIVNKDGEVRALREALISHFEITVLTKPLLEKFAAFTQNQEFHNLLQSKEKVSNYIYGRDLLDLIRDYGPWEARAEDLLAALRKIPARLYSIASSLKSNPDEVHLTIGTVRYDSHGRKRTGVCSGQCAERTEIGDQLSVFVQKNQNFKLPEDPSVPIIMIGAGTGVAPYRSFLEEREETESSGKAWLFFGEQHFVTDFLYQIEWQRWLKEGVLTKMDVAFSRDTSEKVYVQHRLHENSKELFEWMESGAHVYVCGDEQYMAKDVHETLVSIVEKEGNMSPDQAESYVAELRQTKRYQRDVY